MSYLALIGEWLYTAASDILFNVVIAFLLVALGICLGFIVKGISMAIFRAVKLDELIGKLHIGDLFGKLSVSTLFADIFEITIIIAFTVQAFGVLGWNLIGAALSKVLYWIPSVIAGLVIFLIVYAVGRWLESRMRESESDDLHRFAPVVMVVIAFFGAILGLDQIGLDTSLIKQAVLILVFGFALAFALAVGIAAGFGLKDEAAGMVHRLAGTRKAKSSTRKAPARKRSTKRRK